MKDAEKTMKKYIRAVGRRLDMPKDVKKRVMNDFVSSIQGRREAGQTDEDIRAELGSPRKAAAELNKQMKEYTYTKSPLRWVLLAMSILSGILLLFNAGTQLLVWLLNRQANHSIGIIGGADGPTAIFVTSTPPSFSYYMEIIGLVILVAAGIAGFYHYSHRPGKK